MKKSGDYNTVRRTISIYKNVDEKVERIKKYPKWKNNRSALVNEALEQFLKEEP